jgi:REP element-mobilizing transposase RayT
MTDYFPPLEPGICYHIYNRGNNRENIFLKPENYQYFLNKYALYMARVLDTYVYNLLPNHFHIVARIKRKEEIVPAPAGVPGVIDFPSLADLESLSVGEIVSELFRRFFIAYAKAINKQEGRVGSLFQKNFKRRPVQSDGHFINLIYYVHTNATLHGICADFREWPYSSYFSILSEGATRLQRAQVLAWFNSKESFEQHHQQYLDLKNIEDLMIED